MPTLTNYQLAVWFLRNATFVPHIFMITTLKTLVYTSKTKVETSTVFPVTYKKHWYHSF